MNDQIKPAFSLPKTSYPGRAAAASLPDELSRRLLRNRPAHRNRWADWVRALAERYGHGPDRRDTISLVLVHPYQHMRTVRERWLERTKTSFQKSNVWTQQFFPTINLSVQAVIRASGPTLFGTKSSRGVGQIDHHQLSFDSPVLIERREFGTETKPSRRASQSAEVTARPRYIVAEMPSPLERVFRRPEKIATLLNAKGTARQVSGLDEMVRRLERQSQRIESADSEMTPTLSVKANSASSQKSVSQGWETEEQTAQLAGSSTYSNQELHQRSDSNHQMQVNRGPAQMNIDQITDHVIRQLDQKVVAARERMGRSF